MSRSKGMKRIVVVGSANMDMVATVRSFPRPGETVFGSHFGMFPGGKGANQAVCAARLGVPVDFIGKIGIDVLGEKLAGTMKRNRVNLRMLARTRQETTGTALITVDATGQNEITVVSGSNMSVRPADIRRNQSAFRRAAVVLAQLEVPLETVAEAMKLGRRYGAVTILNPAPAATLGRAILGNVDYLTPNETEAEMLSGVRVKTQSDAEKAAGRLLSLGTTNVIVTLGARGCILINREGCRRFPVKRVKAVDTTAAGDAFNGALAVGIAHGLAIPAAITLASRVAAYSVTKMGAIPSMPRLKDVGGLRQALSL